MEMNRIIEQNDVVGLRKFLSNRTLPEAESVMEHEDLSHNEIMLKSILGALPEEVQLIK